MSKVRAKDGDRIVRDSKSGRFVTVRGVGALKGRLAIRKDVDLTEPIASQAADQSGKPASGAARAKS
ncbi:hypothetical protein [Aureimonas leprariae]|uniref:hypothetical protein n=1 Tax=Plantimonas leprariae TaxID=2615207 RepID=UPI001386618C|nr:hypothetical protein [Aureimonas leprariae]